MSFIEYLLSDNTPESIKRTIFTRHRLNDWLMSHEQALALIHMGEHLGFSGKAAPWNLYFLEAHAIPLLPQYKHLYIELDNQCFEDSQKTACYLLSQWKSLVTILELTEIETIMMRYRSFVPYLKESIQAEIHEYMISTHHNCLEWGPHTWLSWFSIQPHDAWIFLTDRILEHPQNLTLWHVVNLIGSFSNHPCFLSARQLLQERPEHMHEYFRQSDCLMTHQPYQTHNHGQQCSILYRVIRNGPHFSHLYHTLSQDELLVYYQLFEQCHSELIALLQLWTPENIRSERSYEHIEALIDYVSKHPETQTLWYPILHSYVRTHDINGMLDLCHAWSEHLVSIIDMCAVTEADSSTILQHHTQFWNDYRNHTLKTTTTEETSLWI